MIFERTPNSHVIAVLGFAVIAFGIVTCVVSGVASGDDRPDRLRYDQPDAIPTLRAELLRVPHRRIIIDDHSLIPKEIVLDYRERFGWLSHSRAASRIVFEREAARSVYCRSLVNFSIEEDELKSSELLVNDVANFCQLEPGRYPYRVVRTDPSTGASRRLDGVVVIRNEVLAAHLR